MFWLHQPTPNYFQFSLLPTHLTVSLSFSLSDKLIVADYSQTHGLLCSVVDILATTLFFLKV